MIIGIAAVILVLFQWDDAALWVRDTNQDTPARIRIQQPGLESFALQVASSPEKINRLHQVVPRSQALTLGGQLVTIGVWMWADQPGKANLPQITSIVPPGDPQRNQPQVVQLSQEPQFFTTIVEIPDNSTRLIFTLNPFEGFDQGNNIYYSRPIMTAGEINTDEPPELLNADLSGGTWSGIQFTNLVRNPDGLGVWPRLRPAVIVLLGKIDYRLEETISWTISLLDIQGTSWFVQGSI